MIPKIMALYLPQFYEVKKNSEWYGDGFTDWVSVKNARSLFPGHKQPRRPLNQNYYDLGDVETIRWQAGLAKEYGIDGFCFYHYWFDSTTRLLEKPAELLLQHKEIDLPFCFSWVNESWKRTWSNVSNGNVWTETYDSKKNVSDNDRGLLAKQRYGREEEWQKHIEYLIPFFKDKRYLRIADRPVLCVYQPCDILCIKSMTEVWNHKLKENGIDGIYLIGASYGRNYSAHVNISYDHEPGTAFEKCRNGGYVKSDMGMECFSYDTMWDYILSDVEYGKLSCAFTDFDASPRKGYHSCIVQGSDPEKFKTYFTEFLKKNIICGNEIVFLNAWNEWGESMYLEPCEDNGYKYLEAVREAVRLAEDKGDKMTGECGNSNVKTTRASKSVLQVKILNHWLSAYRTGIRIENFFIKYHYAEIAIYGMGILGKQLVEELTESTVHVQYYIDRVDVPSQKQLKRYSAEDELPKADCIVITAVAEFDEIYDVLRAKSDMPVINIGEILEDLY